MANWPIVARTTVVDALVDGLARRPARSQLLRGPSGVGKTTVAAAAAAALAARGRTVVPVVALAELTAVPLGALAPLLASSSAAPPAEASATIATPAAGGVADRLAELVALVGRRADAYVIVVDDAPLQQHVQAVTPRQPAHGVVLAVAEGHAFLAGEAQPGPVVQLGGVGQHAIKIEQECANLHRHQRTSTGE